MFWSKKDSKNLEAIMIYLRELLEKEHYAANLEELDESTKQRIARIKGEEDLVQVGGSMDLSAIAEEEQEAVLDSVAAKLAKSPNSFYLEEQLDADELEALQG